LRAVSSFVQIPDDFLESIATESERIPRLYYCGNVFSTLVFWQRLRWIHRLALRHARREGTVLDFGGGGGVFLPTLAGTFARVVSIDLEIAEAEKVVARYELENVRLVRGDATRVELPEAPFDAIVAADVLEHFPDLGPAAATLRRWLAPDGRLFTSLPTENGVYALLRRIYGIEKPPDHYHTGYEVEAFLERHGFRRLRRWYVPLRVRVAPLFLVSMWGHAR
jgi:SAM-dependent methyltransferase